jgi:hypothetical protein
MAHNEDSDPMMMMVSVLHRQQPLGCLLPHPTQLIALDQHDPFDDGGPTQRRYTSHCFYKVSYLMH